MSGRVDIASTYLRSVFLRPPGSRRDPRSSSRHAGFGRVERLRRSGARRTEKQRLAVRQREAVTVRRRRAIFGEKAIDDDLGASGQRGLAKPTANE